MSAIPLEKICWQRMNSDKSPSIHFDHRNKHYVVFGGYTSPGRNSCRTWRFVIREYDPLEDIEANPSFFCSSLVKTNSHPVPWELVVSIFMKSKR